METRLSTTTLNLGLMKSRKQGRHWAKGALKSGLDFPYIKNDLYDWIKSNPSIPTIPWHYHHKGGVIVGGDSGTINTITKDINNNGYYKDSVSGKKCPPGFCINDDKQWMNILNGSNNVPYTEEQMKGLIPTEGPSSQMEDAFNEALEKKNKKGMKTWDEFKKEARDSLINQKTKVRSFVKGLKISQSQIRKIYAKAFDMFMRQIIEEIAAFTKEVSVAPDWKSLNLSLKSVVFRVLQINDFIDEFIDKYLQSTDQQLVVLSLSHLVELRKNVMAHIAKIQSLSNSKQASFLDVRHTIQDIQKVCNEIRNEVDKIISFDDEN